MASYGDSQYSYNNGVAHGYAASQNSGGGYAHYNSEPTVPTNAPPILRQTPFLTVLSVVNDQGISIPPTRNTTWVKGTVSAAARSAGRTGAARGIVIGGIGQRTPRSAPLSLKADSVSEGIDATHRFGEWTKRFWNLFEDRNPWASFPKNAFEFFSWLDQQIFSEQRDTEVVEMIYKVAREYENKISFDVFWSRFCCGVKYMVNDTQRIKYQITTGGGLLHRMKHGEVIPFDTSECSTCFSGRGWAIWVQGMDRNFYTNSHKIGHFHHSSFFAGGNVMGAGEWRVRDGFIMTVSGKSGHYQPSVRSLAASISTMKKRGFCFDPGAVVLLYDRQSRQAVFLSVNDFLSTGLEELVATYVADRNTKSPTPPPSSAKPLRAAPAAPAKPAHLQAPKIR